MDRLHRPYRLPRRRPIRCPCSMPLHFEVSCRDYSHLRSRSSQACLLWKRRTSALARVSDERRRFPSFTHCHVAANRTRAQRNREAERRHRDLHQRRLLCGITEGNGAAACHAAGHRILSGGSVRARRRDRSDARARIALVKSAGVASFAYGFALCICAAGSINIQGIRRGDERAGRRRRARGCTRRGRRHRRRNCCGSRC